MSKIFKNLIPYWKSVIMILLLLFVQAWCDLSLPQYTSDIIDVGIQNQGIEHVLPELIISNLCDCNHYDEVKTMIFVGIRFPYAKPERSNA